MTNEDINKLMRETHEYYQAKFDRLHQENKSIRKTNNKLKFEVKALKRVIYKLKQDKQKQHYRNGQKRGRNGRNG